MMRYVVTTVLSITGFASMFGAAYLEHVKHWCFMPVMTIAAVCTMCAIYSAALIWVDPKN